MKAKTFLAIFICCLLPLSALSEYPPACTFRDIPFGIRLKSFLKHFDEENPNFEESFGTSDYVIKSTESIEAFGYDTFVTARFTGDSVLSFNVGTFFSLTLNFAIDIMLLASDGIEVMLTDSGYYYVPEANQYEFFVATAAHYAEIMRNVEAVYGPMKGGLYLVDDQIRHFSRDTVIESFVEAVGDSEECILVFRNDNLWLTMDKYRLPNAPHPLLSILLTFEEPRRTYNSYGNVFVPNTFEEQARFFN